MHLPFKKVLEAFASMHVRSDQERAKAVPQVETPFLKVTIEDNEKFGTTTEPLETTEFPPVNVEPPTAQAFADAEPEAAADARLKMSPPPSANGATEAKRIPFKLSPNGTDASAPESVPASSGPSVPNFLPSPFAPVPSGAGVEDPGQRSASQEISAVTTPAATPPVRIPFKMAAGRDLPKENRSPNLSRG